MKKRCLQITASLRIGGAEKVARDIGINARQLGFEVDYLIFGDEICGYEKELENGGCRMIHIRAPAESYSQYMKTLKRLMMENRYSVVHAHTMFNIGWAMLAARHCGVPIRIAHAHSALTNGTDIKKSIYEHIMRRLILHDATDLVACGDDAGIRLFGKTAYEKRGKCILNGIEVDRFAFSQEARERIRNELRIQDTFVIGHVGHLAAVKNQAFLIRLMPQILEKKPNAKLLMLGEGEDREKLEKLICDMKLEDRVILTGNVRNVSDYLSAMDVFAFPSLFEGMPLSIVEVQANGLPCVLSTGVPRDVYFSDLLKPFPLECSDVWAEAICRSERSEPGRYASLLKDCGLDTETIMRKYTEIYERVETT